MDRLVGDQPNCKPFARRATAIAAPFPDAKLRPRVTSGSSLNALHITRTLASLMKTSVERYSTDGTV